MWADDDYYEQLLKRIRQKAQEEKSWAAEIGSADLLEALSADKDFKGERIAAKDKPVDYVLSEKLYSLKKNVEHVRQEIKTRWQLKERFQKEMDYQISQAADSFNQLQKGVGYNVGVDMKRNALEQELLKLRSERRSHAVRCWKDIIGLRKELREVMKEYEMLRRMKNAMRYRNGD